jgi:hypothetical protein
MPSHERKKREYLGDAEVFQMGHKLLIYWVRGLISFMLISCLMFFSLNEVNKHFNPENVKPLWFIVAVGVSFGALISLINSLPTAEVRKGEKEFD